MNWDSWLRTWEAHSKTERYRRKLRAAVDIAQQGAEYGRLFGALSGGKDGVAMAGVLCAAGLREQIPLVHCHTDLNTPGMEQCALETAERLDMDLEIIEPESDVWQMLATLPREIPIWDERNHLQLRRAIASGNMLVAHLYAHSYVGSFSGMRSEESRGRLWNRKMRGPLYQLKSDETWMCLPIVDWSARDVFACLVSMGLPIHPHYRLMSERFGVEPESPGSRVDCMLPEERVTSWPIAAQLAQLYPDLWRRIVAIRPELRQQT